MSEAVKSVSPQELEQAFSLFNEASAQLTGAYQELQGQVEHLTGELAVANGELRRQYLEKEALSQRLAMLLAALPAGVVVVDGAGEIREANAAAGRMLGDGLLGRQWSEVVARSLRQTATSHEWEMTAADESLCRLNISVSQLEGGGGQIVLLHDVTEAYQMEQALQRHQRLSAMGEMAAGLAHQLRTPLATALLYVANLAKPGLAEPERIRFSEKALARLRHLEQLIQDMLSFVRGQGGEREAVAVADLLGELRQIIEPQMAQREVCLGVEDLSEGCVLRGDRKALVGAVVNLLENALLASSAGGEVVLRAEATAKGWLALTVRDNGRGFDAALGDRLFEPFFTTRIEGTGLGLAIVRSVAEAHGGTVEAHSVPGEGSEFVLRLPTCVPDIEFQGS
ncbi:PAS domain-containing sensor histidine kinase [Sulfurimicrobium lacus]|uniref:histidine kinase n=1 Tax=Sulfurimicrobium lacus TaxID=2715678 RepID=A0A6F8VAY4_9PROT|nr:ATP-binding protein [Sulfurimicrobium lacus]BCB26166.1 PAS domain-containing sensor histidine kinase [Sulfurimicrobium lacus]